MISKIMFLGIAVFALVGIMVPLNANAAPPGEQCTLLANKSLICNFVPQNDDSASVDWVASNGTNCVLSIGIVNPTGERTGTLSGSIRCDTIVGLLADDTPYRVIGKI